MEGGQVKWVSVSKSGALRGDLDLTEIEEWRHSGRRLEIVTPAVVHQFQGTEAVCAALAAALEKSKSINLRCVACTDSLYVDSPTLQHSWDRLTGCHAVVQACGRGRPCVNAFLSILWRVNPHAQVAFLDITHRG